MAMAQTNLYNPLKLQVRQAYPALWHTDLTHAITADCCWCFFSAVCAPCSSYMLRSRTLYGDMSRYQCCAGYMPCSGQCGEQKCPEFCLCMEVSLCFASSVTSTRFLLQDQFSIQTSPCDNCIIATMFFMQQLACICSLIACITGSGEIGEAANIITYLSDLIWCTVCACMQTQHKVQLDKRDGKFGDPPAMAPPPEQQMARIDQGGMHSYPQQNFQPNYPPAPQQGYPPQGQPGYPPQQYPQQPPQQYPQQPPQQYPQQPPQQYPQQPAQQYPPRQFPPQQYPPQQYPPPQK